jgi:GNAT superfamily N-acetyltransferase
MTGPTIRDACPSDYEAYAELYLELAVPDPVPPIARYESELMAKSFVIEHDGVIGWGLIETLEGVGYVRNVIVRPSARRGGLGRAIMREAAHRFRAAGCTRWCLNVKPENLPAVALYRSLGMAQAYVSVALRLSWAICERLPSGQAVVDTPVADELAAIEADLSVTPGLLAAALARDDRHVVVARAQEVVGVASFDPAFPGCYPFRARSAADARAIFEALAPHAEHPHLQIVCEDQPELVEALETAGAERVLSFVHFDGLLPE